MNVASTLAMVITAQDETLPATSSARKNLDSVKGCVETMGGTMSSAFSQIKMLLGGMLGFAAVNQVVQSVTTAVDGFNQSIIQTAALITSMQGGGGDVAERYAAAKEYAEALQTKLIEINGSTFASAQDLSAMTGEMLKQGVLLDINNKKQVDGFVNIANAVSVVAQGFGNKEIQIHQEVRALMQGQVDMQSQLSQQVNAMVGGSLKQKVELWKQEGTIVEHIGELLVGYAAAQGDIQSTWGAVKTTLESIWNVLARSAFGGIFKDVVSGVKDFSGLLQGNIKPISEGIKQVWGDIKEGISAASGFISSLFTEMTDNFSVSDALHGVWLTIKAVVQGVWEGITAFKEPLQVVLFSASALLNVFGRLVYDVFPPLMDRVSAFAGAIWENVKMLGNMTAGISAGLMGNFTAAGDYFKAAGDNFKAGGVKVAQAFRSGFGDEIARRDAEWEASFTKGVAANTKNVKTPEIFMAPTQEQRDAVQKMAEAVAKYAESTSSLGKAQEEFAKKQFDTALKEQEDTVSRYGAALKDLEGIQAKFGTEQLQTGSKVKEYADNLRMSADLTKQYQQVLIDGIKPVNDYLAVVQNAADRQKTALQDSLDALGKMSKIDPKTGKNFFADDTAKAVAQVNAALVKLDADTAAKRLAIWQDFYNSRLKLIQDKEKEIETLQKDLLTRQLEQQKQMMQLFTPVVDDSYKDPATKYLEQNQKWAEQIDKAKQIGGEAGISILKQVQDEIAKLATVKEGISVEVEKVQRSFASDSGVFVGISTAVESMVKEQVEVISQLQKMADLKNLLQKADDSELELMNDRIKKREEELKQYVEQKQTALAAMKDIQEEAEKTRQKLAELDRKVMLTLDDKVSGLVPKIKSVLDELKDKVITITAQYVSTGNAVSAMQTYPAITNTPNITNTNPIESAAPTSTLSSSDYYISGGNYFWGDGMWAGEVPSYAVGTNYVPKTGLALIHRGEKIIPANQNQAGSGGITIQGDIVVNAGTTSDPDQLARLLYGKFQQLSSRYR